MFLLDVAAGPIILVGILALVVTIVLVIGLIWGIIIIIRRIQENKQ